jgi:hypothetical protein
MIVLKREATKTKVIVDQDEGEIILGNLIQEGGLKETANLRIKEEEEEAEVGFEKNVKKIMEVVQSHQSASNVRVRDIFLNFVRWERETKETGLLN